MTNEDRALLALARHRKAVDGGEVWTDTARAWLHEANSVCLDALRRIRLGPYTDTLYMQRFSVPETKPHETNHGTFSNAWDVQVLS